jgi:predicted phosphate transport protein (TIGR00153 family)
VEILTPEHGVRLIPRDQEFFSMFGEIARRVTAAAKIIHLLFKEPEHLHKHVSDIKDVEHEADVLTHDIISRIDKTFVTPLDREDIHMLASRLDDVVDLLDGTARRAAMFRIRETREPAQMLAAVLVRAAARIEEAVFGMKKSALVIEKAREIKALEEEGDAIYHLAVGSLFDGDDPDPLEVIKWKELYDTLERALDQCEDVANVLESISLKNA